MIRKLYANENALPGTWDKASCADALLQIASTVTVLSKQLEQLWRLANRDMTAKLDAHLVPSFEQIDAGLAARVQALALELEAECEREAA